MRRYLQSVGRMLYTKTSSRMTSPILLKNDKNILSSPLPIPKDNTTENVNTYVEKVDSPKVEVQEQDVLKSDNLPLYQSTFDQMFCTRARSVYVPNHNKITVVGAGPVGLATVFTLLTKGISNNINMIDFNETRLKGELMDMQSGCKFLQNAKLTAGKDFCLSGDSKICVITPVADTTYMEDVEKDTLNCHVEVLKSVIPQLLKYSPDTIILVAIDPVDVLSYLAWRVSGLTKRRVIGTGNNLYTATFRSLLANKLGLSPSSCSGYIIGENGESCVPVWSGVTVGGVKLRDLNPEIGTHTDPENWQEIHRQVVRSKQEMHEFKRGSSWAAGLSVADICGALLNESNTIRPISTYVKGEYSINEEVFLSLPCVLGNAGVTDIIKQPLSTAETLLLHRSVDAVAENQASVKFVQ